MSDMPCGHPLAARRIVSYDEGKRLRTDCWACMARAQEIARIVGPKRAGHPDARGTI